MTANAIWRGLKECQDRDYLWWTDWGRHFVERKRWWEHWLNFSEVGCLPLLSAFSARWCLYTVLSTLQIIFTQDCITVLLTNSIFMWGRVGWARLWVWHDVEVTCGGRAFEGLGGAGAGVNKSHFVDGEHWGKWRGNDCQCHLKRIWKSSNQLNGDCHSRDVTS